MKIGLLIIARLKSTRLPMKLLLDLNGRSVVERVLDRGKRIAGINEIVLCTSTNAQDRPLVDVAIRNGVYYYLGDPDDVLKRLLDAAKFFDLDYIVNITGENPYLSVEYANRVVQDINTEKADLTFYEGLPLGCAVYGIKTKALEVVCSVKKEIDTEIWGPLLNRPDIFRVHKSQVDPFYKRPEIRITNDYPEDYQFLNAIAREFPPANIPSLFDVLTLFDSKPALLDINKARIQASLSAETLQRIDDFFVKNRESILALKQQIYSHDN